MGKRQFYSQSQGRKFFCLCDTTYVFVSREISHYHCVFFSFDETVVVPFEDLPYFRVYPRPSIRLQPDSKLLCPKSALPFPHEGSIFLLLLIFTGVVLYESRVPCRLDIIRRHRSPRSVLRYTERDSSLSSDLSGVPKFILLRMS